MVSFGERTEREDRSGGRNPRIDRGAEADGARTCRQRAVVQVHHLSSFEVFSTASTRPLWQNLPAAFGKWLSIVDMAAHINALRSPV